jgi:aspartyl protease family protein
MRRTGPLASLALAVVLTASAGMPGFGRPVDTPELRLMAITELAAGAGGHFMTTADINGQNIQVLVDTGASAVALSFEDAEAAGLRPHGLDYVVPVATANGMTKAAKVKLRYVEIDAVKVRDVDGLVLPQGAINGTLLGMSFLSRLKSFSVSDGRLTLKN